MLGIVEFAPTKSQFSQNKFIWLKNDVTSPKIYFSTDLFYNKNSKYLIKKSKIADFTCQIMRKFIFPTYSSFYARFLTCDLPHSPPI